MYVIGKGANIEGPGTGLVQRINWTQGQESQFRKAYIGPVAGLGCACRGMGCGLGLFESGFDFSQWSAVEWTLVALGGYMALSTLFTTQRAATRVGRSVRRLGRRKAVATV